ncbi:MAG: glycoside hydrolase family 13 protein [Clostridiales bacterium]|nr:glycoside hydrolase family 13 protein [Clostridiales bacterium]
MMLHDSHKAFFRQPMGPAAAGSVVTIRFQCDEATAIILRTWQDEELCYAMLNIGNDIWETAVQLPEIPGLYWYRFIVYRKDGHTVTYGNQPDQMGGEGMAYTHGEAASFQITVYDKAFKTPAYFHSANIYQIFPDRFFRAKTAAKDDRKDRYVHKHWDEEMLAVGDMRGGKYQELDFYGGNLNGIRAKLPYLKELGVDIIYLNPIFRARSNHRYDTGDYTQIDPLCGTEEEFQILCEEAAAYGIRVLLDGVFSHTGEDSVYFNHFGHYPNLGAYQGDSSPYYDWYTFKKFPEDYRAWWGIMSLPELRKDNPEYQKFMFQDKEGIVPRWIHDGACGWRLDVADELSMDFLRKLRVAAHKANPNAVVLGEVWEDASNKVAYGEMRCYCTGDTLDSVMNYPLREAILAFATGKSTAADLVRLVKHQAEVYPAQFRYALMNLIGSHDRPRALNMLVDKGCMDMPKEDQQGVRLSVDEYALAVKRYKMCVDLLCALPGCPTIYYGDEAGLCGCHDPWNRRPFPWGKEDTALQQYISNKLTHRQRSDVLRYGLCDIEAVDADTLTITRYMDGNVDGLGNPTTCREREVITICRK